jgi:AraC-like DNA-binding protein
MDSTLSESKNAPYARRLPLQMLHIGRHEAPQGADTPRHCHTTWEIVLYRAGYITCPLGDETFIGKPGVVLATPPQTFHEERAETAFSNTFLGVSAPPDTPWPRYCEDDEESTLARLFAALHEEFHADRPLRAQLLEALLAQLDIALRRRGGHAALPEAERVVREAERLLAERFAMPLSLRQIALELHVSPSTLRAHFAAVRGCSPQQYLHRLRVNQAMRLLQAPEMKLETVAARSGFHSASHLSRHIKRATGRPPGAVRSPAARKSF